MKGNTFWALLFGTVLFACFASLVVAPLMGYWLPRNVCIYGGDVDFLFYIILAATGVFFVLTEVFLVVAIWRFGDYSPSKRASHSEGNLLLEAVWTIIPGIILIYIAFAQIPAWAWITFPDRRPTPDQVVSVVARQWEWRMRYHEGAVPSKPREWAENGSLGDLHVVNELHTWKGANVTLLLKTQDVLHSFYLPNFRRKQDLLPGKTMTIWINATDSNTVFDKVKNVWRLDPSVGPAWEIACAELCGGRHYAMRGVVFVHPDEDDYKRWLKSEHSRQNMYRPETNTTNVAKP